MTSCIRVLPDDTINKVAAGEVVENSASVVKELVENAIDAKACNITIEIRGGGRQLIRITDDGVGMSEDDALLAFERHATSKIRSIDDIHGVSSMGFRGEAVPSIAAISKFTLITRHKEHNDATMIIVDGGKILKVSPAPRSPGTTIEVKSLFFNVPVRRKFQKAPAHDEGEILKMVSQLALGHPHIKFELISGGKPLISTPVYEEDTLKRRISDVLGKEFAGQIMPISATVEGITVEGFIGNAYTTRANRTGQHLFINRRAIFSPVISHAVLDGYGTSITPKRFPLFVLHLTLSGDDVDVNVHPQKREVRFRRAMQVREVVQKTVENALQTTSPVPTRSSSGSFNPSTGPSWSNIFAATTVETMPTAAVTTAPTTAATVAAPQTMTLRSLSCVPGYILADARGVTGEKQDGLVAIDQHAAHARVLYEAAKKSVTAFEAQALLVPIQLSPSPAESAKILRHLDNLTLLGIDIHESGPNTFLVDAIPQLLDGGDITDTIGDIVEELDRTSTENIRDQKTSQSIAHAATMAAVSTKKTLSLAEAQNLVDALVKCSEPVSCPKGGKTLSWITPVELAKLF